MTDTAVETASCKVLGTVVEDVLAFKTVPYAAPAGGANRFRPLRRAERWAGIQDCSMFTGRAPQVGLRPKTWAEREDFSGAPDPSPETKDCLTVHIWSVGADSAAKSSVMVWFHGGVFA